MSLPFVNITEIEEIIKAENMDFTKEVIKGIYPRWLGLGNLSRAED